MKVLYNNKSSDFQNYILYLKSKVGEGMPSLYLGARTSPNAVHAQILCQVRR